eukprot:CAMPEP_0195319572 /NCGR_PEP_ID=MMETSP0708-20121125/5583_1 /TAXON_ID=33640 /ORGANISM="Asterionellopsis glacialis, Strain CCMP134" /LENGTH=149 /DNA_ID=CAMNT_0040385807 /DNA_START=242 /DNA_END=691 /DNA_ORIENTATION=-
MSTPSPIAAPAAAPAAAPTGPIIAPPVAAPAATPFPSVTPTALVAKGATILAARVLAAAPTAAPPATFPAAVPAPMRAMVISGDFSYARGMCSTFCCCAAQSNATSTSFDSGVIQQKTKQNLLIHLQIASNHHVPFLSSAQKHDEPSGQ